MKYIFMIGQEFYHKYRKNIPINFVYYNFSSGYSERKTISIILNFPHQLKRVNHRFLHIDEVYFLESVH